MLKKISQANRFIFSLKKQFSTNKGSDNFLNGTSAFYVEQMFQQWKNDKNSVHASWNQYFTNIEKGLDHSVAFQSNPEISGSNKFYLI